jgi:SAM-dependent methyltransferase
VRFHPPEPPRQDGEWLAYRFSDVRSVADFGCNNGQMLRTFRSLFSLTDTLGIDGDDYSEGFPGKFLLHDLRKPLDLGRKFDLVVCVEVAEHLPKSFADVLVATLIRHSDLILFSAAHQGQGGHEHLNEQPPEYWIEKFVGYESDATIRQYAHSWWLQQNLLLFKRSA